MASNRFVIDGICHPYNFSEENLKGRFGRIFDDVLYAFHPLLNPPETVLSKEEWQHDWQNDEFLETAFLEGETDMACVHSGPVFDPYHVGFVSVEKGQPLDLGSRPGLRGGGERGRLRARQHDPYQDPLHLHPPRFRPGLRRAGGSTRRRGGRGRPGADRRAPQ